MGCACFKGKYCIKPRKKMASKFSECIDLPRLLMVMIRDTDLIYFQADN